LQELLAPDNVRFFANDWSRIGSKATLASALHEIAHIREEILLGIPCKPSIAERMSWAAGRKTQKKEDRAYSLMGIFDIYMPIIYGEGGNSFRRLQLEIMRFSNDKTIFAWHRRSIPIPERTAYWYLSQMLSCGTLSIHSSISIAHHLSTVCSIPQGGTASFRVSAS
jgi:hypothetical protein